MPPTTAQQEAIAYGPMVFAAISFVSSIYVIYHLLFQEWQKLKRLYHRLVLAMNIALLPLSLTQVWSTMAVPEGTPYYVGAMGTMNTCVIQGFIKFMFTLTVTTYYGSLVLQALMGMRNNFKEENYRWIEIRTHLVAYCIPCMFAIVFAATKNINPSGNGCYYAKAPQGCESDPEIPCRGQDIKPIVLIVGFTQIFLSFIFPTSMALFMFFWMKKKQKERPTSGSGMTVIREKARKEMTHKIYLQISIYLISIWSTFILVVISTMYQVLTGDFIYNLFILANCIYALQGFIFMVVYFTLQKMGEQSKGEYVYNNASLSRGPQYGLTVADIRAHAQRRAENSEEEVATSRVERFTFNVFDGSPDPNSPWAMFFDEGDALDEGEEPMLSEEINPAYD